VEINRRLEGERPSPKGGGFNQEPHRKVPHGPHGHEEAPGVLEQAGLVITARIEALEVQASSLRQCEPALLLLQVDLLGYADGVFGIGFRH
jgi:hypothetical protein